MKAAIAGAIIGGGVVLLFIGLITRTNFSPSPWMLLLWPSFLIGMALAGASGGLIGLLEVSVNALIYGLTGWLIGLAVIGFRNNGVSDGH